MGMATDQEYSGSENTFMQLRFGKCQLFMAAFHSAS